ncbi:hypothetical protein [Boseongicola aestuarii]|uniref:Uncharacterized protein n=1 Tax=Boseongicola aestuarii TaxID=1470561 RepID=A0A238J3H0_9RHOB|nr:hypothetical protein [Boseongicola aestuarii]SMX24705.1 hypothetical protein BOA8489_02832 [Boseongicola aestuarii]
MKDIPPQSSQSDLIDATPSRKLFPGEDRGAFEAFRLALLSELSPSTFYEEQMAENLIDVEWEAFRYRNLRADLVTAKGRDRCAKAIESSVNTFGSRPSEESIATAATLFGPDGAKQKTAVKALEAAGTNLDEIVACAYAKELGTLSHIERHLADIEPRRRRLLDDLERLKARRSRDIPDAEIVDDNGD